MADLCKGCGKPIVWGETTDGKKIPLDPRPPVYMILSGQSFGTNLKRIERMKQDEGMVTHFATCSKVDEFSGKNR